MPIYDWESNRLKWEGLFTPSIKKVRAYGRARGRKLASLGAG